MAVPAPCITKGTRHGISVHLVCGLHESKTTFAAFVWFGLVLNCCSVGQAVAC